jgi:hypothetical protein
MLAPKNSGMVGEIKSDQWTVDQYDTTQLIIYSSQAHK